MQTIISLITAALYLATSTMILVRLRKLASGVEAGKSAVLWLWGVALPVHATVLYQQILTDDGLNLQFFHAASLVTLLIAALLWLSSISRPLENLGLVVLPLAAISLLGSQFLPMHAVLVSTGDHAIAAHVLISLLAYSVLTLSAFQALLLAIQNRHLHNHRPGGLIRALPPLQVMEELLFNLIGLGVLLLSASLITGFMYLDDIFAQHLVHKTILSIAAWIVFCVLLWGRWRFGWRGRKAIRWTLGGFAVLMLAYFGTKFVVELILQRGA